jgi:hypothetical protein
MQELVDHKWALLFARSKVECEPNLAALGAATDG